MADKPEDLPLHAEAEAREKWRGGETIIAKGDEEGLPASEVDNAAEPAKTDSVAGRADLLPPD